MRIAFVVNQLALGGAERQAADVAKALRRRGHDCVLFSFYGKLLLAEELRRAGVEVVPLGAGRRYWSGVLPLSRAFARRRIDVVNTHMPLAGAFGRVAAAVSRVPVVSTEQLPATWLPLHVRVANDLTLNLSSRIICISQEVRRTLYRRTNPYLLRRPGVHVIYNSIDVERLAGAVGGDLSDVRSARAAKRRELGLRGEDVVIANVGRYDEQKGQRHLIDAFARVLVQHPRAALVLVGWGPLEGALRARAARLGIADRVLFLVERADAPAILAASDVFAFPSLYEGLGIALLEAMVLGLPIVASDIAPLTEVVENDREALLVPPRDVAGLARALADVIGDANRAARLGAAARVRADAFTVDQIAPQYERVFAESARACADRPRARMLRGSRSE